MIRPRRRTRPTLTPDHWRRSDTLQEQYARQLRAIAREVGRIVSPLQDGPDDLQRIMLDLARYADTLEPWAKATARRMWERVDNQDRRMWIVNTRMIGRNLRREIENAPTGEAQRQFMQEQVTLIKSLPLDASERVHKLVLEGQMNAVRYPEIAAKIRDQSKVSQAKAVCIARTEASRAAMALTQARAEFVGSEGYIWTTSGDADVRESHRKLGGTYHRWDDPPEHEEGGGKIYRSHPGAIFNCRCFPAVVLPED